MLSEAAGASNDEVARGHDQLTGSAQLIMARYQERIVDGLRSATKLLPAEVAEPCQYHLGLLPLARPGKALRPTLTMLLAEGLGGVAEWGAQLGTAVQLIHDFSLLHDDIVDEDRSRRGQVALWVRDGMPTALNSGDALLTLAFLVISGSDLPAELTRRASANLAQATLEMVGGQQADISAIGAPPSDLSDYLRIVDLKTGALMGTATALGAIAAGATEEAVAACQSFGRTLGVAFQLRDDVLGVFGDAVETGKPVGNDLLRGKQGLPLLLALNSGGDLGEEARSWLGPVGLRAEQLGAAVALLQENGISERCHGLTSTWTERALTAAAKLPLAPPIGEDVELLCRWLGERWS